MTVKELRKVLEQMPEESLVVMSKDGEGNSFSPLAALQPGMYREATAWSGTFHQDHTGRQATCLWPAN